METEVTAALIVSVLSLGGSVFAASSQLRMRREEHEHERRSTARGVLESYRGPLLSAASELGDRIDNIRHRGFVASAAVNAKREQQAKLTTLFRFAQFFGWREVLRTEVQLLRFENEADTQLVASLIGAVVWAFASDSVDDKHALVWSEEQRAIGELMVIARDNGPPRSLGYATFARQYAEIFAPWMDDLAGDVLSARAPQSDRLRLLQWALYGLVMQLDEERAYRDRPWIERARDELRANANGSPRSRLEARVLELVAKVQDR